ncbi:DUF1501 domain-containing protein [Membranicola marinus]|uniref:DUF1501 domain-containing protein n=1 Tax=Membranihabitans marinus TaxID=1227546 RepID=A0A953HPW8_9BACT|nr:DUF1501 domain-containing protein [Membranihabitans marinus]MBY5958658.1 DUF1501 domain-containing protein [Membranihabitans marinus]
MNRRQFLQNFSAITLPVGLGLPGFSGFWGPRLMQMETDRVLIIIQLIGGCDGLNAFIPIDQYGALQAVRSNILPDEKAFLKAGDKNGFHPSLTGFHSLFEKNRMTVVQNVGYPFQNRSHFRSTDIWNTASQSNEYLDTGWVGRYVDQMASGEPVEYPWAVSLGRTVSETCQGLATNHGVSLKDPTQINELPYGEAYDWGDGAFAKNMNFIHSTIKANNVYGALFEEKYNAGKSMSDKYPANNPLAEQLRTIATLMAGGLQSPVYTVSLGGFDTHAGQVNGGNPLEGTFPGLLQTLGDALEAFWDDLALLGLEDRVLAMTYSEFGRKIRSNASFGTDHGDAAPMFLFGSCLQNSIIGTNPVIDPEVSPKDGVPYEIDFRNIYGSILSDWFAVPASDLPTLLPDHAPEHVDLLRPGCGVRSAKEPGVRSKDFFEVDVYPNPASGELLIRLDGIESKEVNAQLINLQGSQIKKWTLYGSGSKSIEKSVDISSVPAGAYVLRVHQAISTQSKKVIVQ